MTNADVSSKTVSSSIKWVAVARLLSQLATFATTIFALKFLTQAEYGLVSLALIFMGILDTITDFGFGAALIQKQDLTEGETSSVFWLLVALALGFVAAGNVMAISAAWFFKQEAIENLIKVLSLALLVSPIHIVYRARLSRQLKLPLLSKCDLLGLIIRSSTTLTLAASGAGAWSFIIGFMAEKFCVAGVLVLAQKWLPKASIDIASIKSLSKFGLKITADRIVYFLLYRIDSLIVAKLLGAHALGLYSYAQQFVSAILQIIQTTGVNVAYPLFARYQTSEKLVPTLHGAERLVALISLPALIGLSLTAQDLVTVTVGESWQKSVPYIQVLAIAGIFQMMSALLPQLMNAINRTALNLLINTLSALLFASLLILAIMHYEETGFLVALISFQCVRYIAVLLTAKNIIDIQIGLILSIWVKATVPAAGMAGIVLILQLLTADASALTRLFFSITAGAATYAALNLIFYRQQTLKILRHLRT